MCTNKKYIFLFLIYVMSYTFYIYIFVIFVLFVYLDKNKLFSKKQKQKFLKKMQSNLAVIFGGLWPQLMGGIHSHLIKIIPIEHILICSIGGVRHWWVLSLGGCHLHPPKEKKGANSGRLGQIGRSAPRFRDWPSLRLSSSNTQHEYL
jgi:hypothetical protein